MTPRTRRKRAPKSVWLTNYDIEVLEKFKVRRKSGYTRYVLPSPRSTEIERLRDQVVCEAMRFYAMDSWPLNELKSQATAKGWQGSCARLELALRKEKSR